MKNIAQELESLIQKHYPAFKSMDDSKFIFKPDPSKWSKKEIIGHLIDSAESNIRRFVVTQYEENATIVYQQVKWVEICNYQQWDAKELIDLWFLLNRQICEILKNTSDEVLKRKCKTEEPHTIEWLALDYIKHLKHHLHQVLDLEPYSY
jgi:DinB superfamily